MAFRLFICRSCGYREHIGGRAAEEQDHVCPECRAGGGALAIAYSRIEYERPDGTTYRSEYRPGLWAEGG